MMRMFLLSPLPPSWKSEKQRIIWGFKWNLNRESVYLEQSWSFRLLKNYSFRWLFILLSYWISESILFHGQNLIGFFNPLSLGEEIFKKNTDRYHVFSCFIFFTTLLTFPGFLFMDGFYILCLCLVSFSGYSVELFHC